MIRFDHVTVTYPGARRPALVDVELQVDEGELVLVAGPTGAGKSTLLRAINGLVPHFTGGQLRGRVLVAGRDTRTHPPRELVDVVGIVLQDPATGFVCDDVEDELAYGMESLGLPPAVMRRRVEETLDVLGLADLRDRPLRSLSGGQQQRVAIGAVLTTHPKVLVLDEPTSALDPPAAEEVLATLARLVQDLGLTVLVAEHRLERVVQFADRMVVVTDDGRVAAGPTAQMLDHAPVAPPIVELARTLHWSPPPVSVRDARRRAEPLRSTLANKLRVPAPPPPRTDALLVDASHVSVRLGRARVLCDVALAVAPSEVVAVMGRNGAGKTTLLRTLAGLIRPDGGRVAVDGVDPANTHPRTLLRHVGLVPQDARALLLAESVGGECHDADRDAGVDAGTTAGLVHQLGTAVSEDHHPGDLSEGQRLTLALAVVLAADPPVLLLDEPTRGLDYPSKERLVAHLRHRAREGSAVVVATHDVEFVAELADRVVVLAGGEVVADGPARDVVTGSPQFAPQVAKVMAPLPCLTVAELRTALASAS